MPAQSREQKSLLDFITNENEKAIARAVESSEIIGQSKDIDRLLKVVSTWRMYIGIPKTDVAEELVVNAKFIYENYPHLTFGEVELAINLSVLMKLGDTEFHGYFSPMYIAKVLNAYLHYRKVTMADAIRRRDKAMQDEEELKNKPTPEEAAKNMQDMMRGFYAEWKETGQIRDMFNIAYDFLYRTKMLKVTRQTYDEAVKYGKEMVEEIKKKKPYGKISFNVELEEKRWAKNYCVQKFFKIVDIDILCNNIKSDFFS